MRNPGQGCRRCLRGGRLPASLAAGNGSGAIPAHRRCSSSIPDQGCRFLPKRSFRVVWLLGGIGDVSQPKPKAQLWHRHSSTVTPASLRWLSPSPATRNTATLSARGYFQPPHGMLFKARWPPEHFQRGQEPPVPACGASQLHHHTHTDQSHPLTSTSYQRGASSANPPFSTAFTFSVPRCGSSGTAGGCAHSLAQATARPPWAQATCHRVSLHSSTRVGSQSPPR